MCNEVIFETLTEALNEAVEQHSQQEDLAGQQEEVAAPIQGAEVVDAVSSEDESLGSEAEEGDPAAEDESVEAPQSKKKRTRLSLKEIVENNTVKKSIKYLYLIYQKDLSIVKVGITRLKKPQLLSRYRTYYHIVHSYALYPITNGKTVVYLCFGRWLMFILISAYRNTKDYARSVVLQADERAAPLSQRRADAAVSPHRRAGVSSRHVLHPLEILVHREHW